MLNKNDKIVLVACSNSLKQSDSKSVLELKNTLENMGLSVVLSNYIFAENAYYNETVREKAQELNHFFADSTIKAVFDISGGDAANTILEYVDFDLIKNNPKPFWGYSDLTAIINCIYTKTDCTAYLYQVKNLIWNGDVQKKRFSNSVFLGKDDLFNISWRFIQGKKIEGTVVGGNLRCFLKLSATPYFPDLTNNVLFLESFSGGAEKIATYFYQLRQMGTFTKISGLLIGTFTQLEKERDISEVIKLVKNIVDNPYLPIAKTQEVGHSSNSKCLIIGSYYTVN